MTMLTFTASFKNRRCSFAGGHMMQYQNTNIFFGSKTVYLDRENYLPYLSLEMFVCTLSPHVTPPMFPLTRVQPGARVLTLPRLSAGLRQHGEQRPQGQRVLSGRYLLRDW